MYEFQEMVGPRKRKSTPRSGSAGSSRKLPKASEAPTEVASAPPPAMALSSEQLVLITETVTKSVMQQLRTSKDKPSVDSAGAELPSSSDATTSQAGTSQGSNDTELVIRIKDITSQTAATGENAIIMQTGENAIITAASLPVPLGMHVDSATKSKIWSNQFVDLSLLLSRKLSQSFKVVYENDELTMVPKKKVFQLNMDQWNQAFTIYMSIYVEKFPLQSASMLQYMGHIQEMA